MKRDFLKSLGIEDKETIDKILDENSVDIGRAKGELDDLKSQVTNLQKQLESKTNEFDTLKEKTKDYDSFTEKINQLELEKSKVTTENAQLKVDLDTKVSELLKNHAIENGVRDAKAKNVKAVMALLDVDKITYTDGKLDGLQSQLDNLISDENSSFMFGEKTPSLSGTQPGNANTIGGGSPPTSKSLDEAIANYLRK